MSTRTLPSTAEAAACDVLIHEVDARRAVRRWRARHAAPHLAAAALLVCGYGADLAAFLSGSTSLVAAVVSAVAFGAVGLAATPAARAKIPTGQRGWALLAGLTASTWLTLATLGITWPMVAALLAADYSLGARWWQRYRLPHRTDTPLDLDIRQTTAIPSGLAEYEVRFAERVATHAAKGVLGATLTQGVDEDGIYSWAMGLDGGETLADVQARAGGIASRMRLPVGALAFDAWPLEPGELGDDSRIRMQILTASPVFEAVPWSVPTVTDGRIPLGPWVDGRGSAAVPVVVRGGVRHLVVIGSTGSGKSSTVNGAVASQRANYPTVTLYFDPKGNSSPDLRKNSTVAMLGLDDAWVFTRAVERLVEGRGYESAFYDWSTFTPSAERPIYSIVIDECDMLFALKGMADRWAMIAKTGRALGVLLILMTQYAGLKAFGGSELLRSNVVGGGSVVLQRTGSNTSDKLIAPGLPPSRFLPRDPGYAYLDAEDARRVALRVAVLRSSDDAEPGVPHAGDVLARYGDVPVDEIGRVALGDLLVPAAEREAANRAAVKEKLAAFLAGHVAAVPEREQPSVLEGYGRVIAFPTALRPAAPAALTDAEQAVLSAVCGGTERPVDIQRATGYGETWVLKQVKALVARGLIENAGSEVYGRYVPAGARDRSTA